MTANQFRTLALELPESEEASHMDHPDFRIRRQIFATLGPYEAWGMVKLTSEQQQEFIRDYPIMFEPIPGAWGERGCTKVNLRSAKKEPVRQALLVAWRNTAPKRLLGLIAEES